MIALFGYGGDQCLDLVSDAARELDVPLLLIDQRLGADVEFVLSVAGDRAIGTVTVAGQKCRLDDLDGVYARPLSPVRTTDPRGNERSLMLHRAFLEWLDVADLLVVNRPAAMLSNASKPFQAQLIAAAGFTVPTTLITNDPAEARAFWNLHGEVIFKSISGVRSIVRRLDESAAGRLGRLRDLPTQFQELVRGIDVRVHVVGEQVFATEVRSAAVDYRYARRDGLNAELAEVTLPGDIGRRCVDLAAALNLPLCGIDLRRRPDGTYVCFEVNPMPGFTYYESHTGQPISRAVCELIAGKGR